MRCYRDLKQPEEALASCRTARTQPRNVELMFLEGLLLRERGDLAGAEASLTRLLSTPVTDYYGGLDPGLAGYRARHNLALVYFKQGRYPEAENQWRLALAEQPTYSQAWLGLGEMFAAIGRWQSFDQIMRSDLADACVESRGRHSQRRALLGLWAISRLDSFSSRRLPRPRNP